MNTEQNSETKKYIKEIINKQLISATISNPRKNNEVLRVKIRPVSQQNKLLFQFEAFTSTQVFHKNLDSWTAETEIFQLLQEYRQINVELTDSDIQMLISKKGKISFQKKKKSVVQAAPNHSHNREKQSLLKLDGGIAFLEDLGITGKSGQIIKGKYDKFRQINRFLEILDDVLPTFEHDRQAGQAITIVDFGCGKSYLTFAMYHYLHEQLKYPVRIIGLDLKEKVIQNCQQLAEKYGYQHLSFQVGDIASFTSGQKIDMVVSLHACDTATDFALAQAMKWRARVILAAPCCQHEINQQIRGRSIEAIAPILEYGLLTERFAALLTDGLRAEYLVAAGYDTQILEFVDSAHTAKNILIRAMLNGKNSESNEKIALRAATLAKIAKVNETFSIHPMLEQLQTPKKNEEA